MERCKDMTDGLPHDPPWGCLAPRLESRDFTLGRSDANQLAIVVPTLEPADSAPTKNSPSLSTTKADRGDRKRHRQQPDDVIAIGISHIAPAAPSIETCSRVISGHYAVAGDVDVIPAGEPLSRPPLFRKEDGPLWIAGKAVLCIVFSPAIVVYIIYDCGPEMRAAMQHVITAIAQGVHRYMLRPLLYGTSAVACVAIEVACEVVCGLSASVADVVTAIGHVSHRHMLLPLYHGMLLPLYHGTTAVAVGVWRGVCVVANGVRYAVIAIHRHALVPLYHGSVTVATGLQHAAVSTSQALHRYMLLPLYRGTVTVANGILRAIATTAAAALRYILVPLYRGTTAVASRVWRGVCMVMNGVWYLLVASGQASHRYLLVPLYKGTVKVAEGVLWGVCLIIDLTIVLPCEGLVWISRRAHQHVLSPLHYRVLVPLFHGTSAALRGVWRTVCLVTNGAWHLTTAAARGVHRNILRPLYHGTVAVVSGVWRGVCFIANGIRYALVETALAAHRYLLVPLLHGTRLVVGAVVSVVLRPAGLVIKHCAAGTAQVTAAAAKSIRSGSRVVTRRVHAGAQAVADVARGASTQVKKAGDATSQNVRAAAKSMRGAARDVRDAVWPSRSRRA